MKDFSHVILLWISFTLLQMISECCNLNGIFNLNASIVWNEIIFLLWYAVKMEKNKFTIHLPNTYIHLYIQTIALFKAKFMKLRTYTFRLTAHILRFFFAVHLYLKAVQIFWISAYSNHIYTHKMNKLLVCKRIVCKRCLEFSHM